MPATTGLRSVGLEHRSRRASARYEKGRRNVTPGHWQEVKEVLAAALERPPEERRVYLDRACGEPSLRREVQSLIDAHEQAESTWMGQPFARTGEMLKSGAKLGPYEILARIGAGGMGVVYRARDGRLEREVAIKVLPTGLLTDEATRRRFHKEALALAKLNHPNIAAVYDVGDEQGADYLVMECVQGQSLAEAVRPGAIPEKKAAALGAQIAAALEEAHEQGVVHRDLKPANIMVTPKEQVKVLDFGLAKILRPFAVSGTMQTSADTATMTGTPPYMAPEQLRGEPADARTDIHALGTVLFEMVTGERLYREDSFPRLTDAILHRQPVAPRALNAWVSPEMERIILKCLEKERENRYQSAKELGVDLRRLQTGTQAPTAVARGPALLLRPLGQKNRRKTVVTSIVVLLGIAVVLGYFHPPAVFSGLILPDIPREKQLAVLPFTVIGGDAQKAAFGAGLTETLTAKLTEFTRDPQLQVVPAPEIRLKHIDSVEGARQEFGANLVLEGSLHASGNQVRINFILVNTRTRRQLRANSMTVEEADAFGAEDAVVNAALEMLGMDSKTIKGGEHENYGTQVAGAYDYYLQGRGYLQNYDREENLDSAIQLFQHALVFDKNYALAYAGLGEAFLQKYRLKNLPQWLRQSRDSCRTANDLDSKLPAAHTCLGSISVATGNYADAAQEFSLVLQNEPTSDAAYKGLANAYERMGKLDEAEKTYKEAIALRPQYWATYNWLGTFYYRQARAHEASEMFHQVVALAPDSFRGYSNLAASLMDEGLYDDSIRASQRSIEIRPSDYGYMNLASAYFFQKRYEDAIRVYEQAAAGSPRDPLLWLNLGDGYYWTPGRRKDSTAAYRRCTELATQDLKQNPNDTEKLGILAVCQAMLGHRDAAIESLKRAFRLAPDDPFVMFQAALVHIQFDERDETLRWLAKCRAAGYPEARIRDYPNFQSLHSQPKFQELLGTQ
jgi:serine/threonine-protein kinase